MQCPCQECKSRKLTCHDRCAEYMEYHDALVAAKEAIRLADKAIEFLHDNYAKKKRRWDRRAK